MSLLCVLSAFIETWLDPRMWAFHLRGVRVRVEGHLYAAHRFVLAGDREWDFATCTRCRTQVYQGFRYA